MCRLIGILFSALSFSVHSAEPWFGLEIPTGISAPHQPTILLGDDLSPLPAVVPAGEEGFDALDAARILMDLEQIVDFSVQSRTSAKTLWGRVAGLPSLLETIDWTASQLRQAGLDEVSVDRFTIQQPLWVPTDWRVVLQAEGQVDVELQSAFPQSPSPAIAGTLTAPLVYVGRATPIELAGVDVSGKIAVVHKKGDPGLFHVAFDIRPLINAGAVAIVQVIELPGNMQSQMADGCAAAIPCFHLGGDDGEFLEAAMGAAAMAGTALEMSLELDVELREGATAANAWGVLKGNGAKSGAILINAHADGWFDGASDNGDGLAVFLAMARHFASRERLDRDLLFVATSGHHTPGARGASIFIQQNPALAAATELVINIEHVAQLNMSPVVTRSAGFRDLMADAIEFPKWAGISNQAPYLVNLFAEAATRYGINMNQVIGPGVPGELGGYRMLGVPMAQFIYASPMYHTSADVLATISLPGLERAARFHAYVIEQAAAADAKNLTP